MELLSPNYVVFFLVPGVHTVYFRILREQFFVSVLMFGTLFRNFKVPVDN